MTDPMPRRDLELPPTPKEAELLAEIGRLRDAFETLLRGCSHAGQPIQPGDPMAAHIDSVCRANFRAAICAANALWGDKSMEASTDGDG